MAGRVITEDRAGDHAPGTPWSRTSSWLWNITRVTIRPSPGMPWSRTGPWSRALARPV